MLKSLILSLSLVSQTVINYPPGFTGGANVDKLMEVMKSVIAGTMPAETQTVTTIAPGTPYQVEWDYVVDPNRPVQFRLWIDGVIVRNFTNTDLIINGTVFLTAPGVVPPFTTAQRGQRLVAVTAYDSEGESARADNQVAVMVGFGTAPVSPTGVRIKVGGL